MHACRVPFDQGKLKHTAWDYNDTAGEQSSSSHKHARKCHRSAQTSTRTRIPPPPAPCEPLSCVRDKTDHQTAQQN
jgi:hypothetical protein